MSLSNDRPRLIQQVYKIAPVLLIILMGALVRFCGIDFGLPIRYCRPDEGLIIEIALRFGTGNFRPLNFNYPTFYMYMLFLLFGFYYIFSLISGRIESLGDFKLGFIADSSDFFLLNRCLAAFLGVLTIFFVYKMAKHLFNRRVGIGSAFFLSLAFLHVRDSHFGTTDVPSTFLVVVSLFFIVKSFRNGRLSNYLWAGVFAGLAASTKYGSIFVVVPMLMAHLFNLCEEKRIQIYKFFRMNTAFFDKRAILFLIITVLAFFLGSPYTLLELNRFLQDFFSEAIHLQQGHKGVLVVGWRYHLQHTLWHGLGWSLFLLSVSGILRMFYRHPKKALILFAFPMVYYYVAGRGNTVFLRYMIPVVPFLCIAAAYALTWISAQLAMVCFKRKEKWLFAALALVIIFPSAYSVYQFDRLLLKKDSRVLASKWVKSNVPEGSSIFQTGEYNGKLQLFPSEELVSWKQTQVLPGDARHEKMEITLNYIRENKIKGFNEWEYNSMNRRFVKNGKEVNKLPDYIVVSRSPLIAVSYIGERISDYLAKSYELIKSFEAINLNRLENWFDQQDSFFVPFAGFKEVTRPGPNIEIYEKREDIKL